MLEDLERCEECGHFVLSRELTEVNTVLHCKDCVQDVVVSERAMRMANR